jgi:hypothetical protein
VNAAGRVPHIVHQGIVSRESRERQEGRGMQPISYARHQFPPEVIRHAVWLYLRFTLSYRDVEELLAERGLDASPMKQSGAGF